MHSGFTILFMYPTILGCSLLPRDASQAGLTLSTMTVKVARYSFSGPIPPKFEHKLRRHKQSFGKIATTVVLDKDENLL